MKDLEYDLKRLLVIKAGSSFGHLVYRRGDFEDWILAGTQADINQVLITDMRAGRPLPSYDKVTGVVITGSHAMVTQHRPWSEQIAAWLPGAVERVIPTLAICYGHQLLAYAMGGEVGNNPNGLNFGTIDAHLSAAAKPDALFAGFSDPLRVHVCHTQSVLHLPPDARLLASCAIDPHLAFGVGDCAWGVQFHPEFDGDILAEYIRNDSSALLAQGTDPDMLINNASESPVGSELLKRFMDIVKEMTR